MPAADLVFLHSNYDPDCRAVVDKHFDGYWTLQYGESGGVCLDYEGRTRGPDVCATLPYGEAWFWPAYPGPRIRFRPGERGEWCHRYAAFQGARVARWVADGLWPEEPQPAPGPAGEHAERFDEMLGHIRSGDRWAHARAVHLLEGILLDLAEARASALRSAPPTEPWLAALLDDAEPNFTPDYDAVARAHGMALPTLRRRFKEATGTPLHEYVLQRRVARARTLLGETDLPIKAVADRLGYKDVYFFTRQFRQQVGVPPAAYRRSRQA